MPLSSYPGAIDTTLEDTITNSTVTQNDHATQHNTISDAIVAIETTLGINPQGSFTDVVTRLGHTLINDPGADQIITPTGDYEGISVQASSLQNTHNLISVRNSSGVIKGYWDKVGNLSAASLLIAGSALAASNLSNGTTGSGAVVLTTSPSIASPTLTGTPVAPTPSTGDNSTKVATTAYVVAEVPALVLTLNSTVNLGSSNTDLAAPTGLNNTWYATTGGGTLRSIGTSSVTSGTIVHLRNASSSAITLKHQLAGGTGAKLYIRGTSDIFLNQDETIDLIYDGTNWTEIGRDAGNNVVYRKTTAKAVTNTVTDTDLLNGEITVAAGAMGTSSVVRLSAFGDWINNSGSNQALPVFSLKLGATPTVVIKSPASSVFSSTTTTRYGWSVDATIMNLGAANSQWVSFRMAISALYTPNVAATVLSAFQVGEGNLVEGLNGNGTTGLAAATGQAGNSAAIDTTASMNLILSVINPTATATCETKLYGAIAEIV